MDKRVVFVVIVYLGLAVLGVCAVNPGNPQGNKSAAVMETAPDTPDNQQEAADADAQPPAQNEAERFTAED